MPEECRTEVRDVGGGEDEDRAGLDDGAGGNEGCGVDGAAWLVSVG